jgi:hypothetical protein
MVPPPHTARQVAVDHDEEMSPEAAAALEAGLRSARESIAAGKPFVSLGDFSQYTTEDD